jgi:hypothetical protein
LILQKHFPSVGKLAVKAKGKTLTKGKGKGKGAGKGKKEPKPAADAGTLDTEMDKCNTRFLSS